MGCSTQSPLPWNNSEANPRLAVPSRIHFTVFLVFDPVLDYSPQVKATKRPCIVLVTAPDLKVARKLARTALAARLIACANLLPKIESHYWWQRKIESGTEVLLLLKTTSNRLVALEKLILANHPYDTPEFIVLPIHRGNKRYLAWLQNAVQAS